MPFDMLNPSDPDHLERVARAAGVEQQAERDVRIVVQALLLVAEPIWRWGDGHGGYVLRELWTEAERRGLDVGLTDEFGPSSRVMRLAARDGWLCHYCGHPLGIGADVVRPPQIEHVIPKVQGGNGRLDNLVLACPPCNNAKSGRTPAQWLGHSCCDRHAA